MVEKTLKIYKENDDYVMERINEFNHAFKKHYSKAGLIEALQEYKVLGELEKYDIQASNDVWALVINALSQE
ncbi:hypothetical protein ACDI16_12495 [Oceanobacillus caeni]